MMVSMPGDSLFISFRSSIPATRLGNARGTIYFGPLASFTGSAPANFGLEAG